MRFMGDQSLTSERQYVVASFLIEMALNKKTIQDELFCQLCLQTSQNRDADNCEKGWLLMALCLSCFAPSHLLAKYLLQYVTVTLWKCNDTDDSDMTTCFGDFILTLK